MKTITGFLAMVAGCVLAAIANAQNAPTAKNDNDQASLTQIANEVAGLGDQLSELKSSLSTDRGQIVVLHTAALGRDPGQTPKDECAALGGAFVFILTPHGPEDENGSPITYNLVNYRGTPGDENELGCRFK